jgi:hypothetical protein
MKLTYKCGWVCFVKAEYIEDFWNHTAKADGNSVSSKYRDMAISPVYIADINAKSDMAIILVIKNGNQYSRIPLKWLELPSIEIFKSCYEDTSKLLLGDATQRLKGNYYLEYIVTGGYNQVSSLGFKEAFDFQELLQEELDKTFTLLPNLDVLIPTKISYRQLNQLEPMSEELEKNINNIEWLQEKLLQYVVAFESVKGASEVIKKYKDGSEVNANNIITVVPDFKNILTFLSQIAEKKFESCVLNYQDFTNKLQEPIKENKETIKESFRISEFDIAVSMPNMPWDTQEAGISFNSSPRVKTQPKKPKTNEYITTQSVEDLLASIKIKNENSI